MLSGFTLVSSKSLKDGEGDLIVHKGIIKDLKVKIKNGSLY